MKITQEKLDKMSIDQQISIVEKCASNNALIEKSIRRYGIAMIRCAELSLDFYKTTIIRHTLDYDAYNVEVLS